MEVAAAADVAWVLWLRVLDCDSFSAPGGGAAGVLTRTL